VFKMKMLMVAICLLNVLANPAFAGETVVLARDSPDYVRNPMSPQTMAKVEQVLTDYEALRAALAADKIEEAAGLMEALAVSGEVGLAAAPAPIAEVLQLISKTAREMAPAQNEKGVRHGFGLLSQSVVRLLSENKDLAKGRFIFECPMVVGYGKWVQLSEQLENPYMGSKMLRCGSAGQWDDR
jgi:hypothetical protein